MCLIKFIFLKDLGDGEGRGAGSYSRGNADLVERHPQWLEVLLGRELIKIGDDNPPSWQKTWKDKVRGKNFLA